MNNFIRPLEYQDILLGAADDRARELIEIYQKSNGFITSDIIGLSSHMATFLPKSREDQSPIMSLCGKNALSRRLLGADWANEPLKAITRLDKDYQDMVQRGYRDALSSHAPVFDFISSELDLEGGGVVTARYQRVIVPLQTLHGATILFCYSHDCGSSRQARGLNTNAEPLLLLDPQNIGHASSLLPAVSPR